MGDAILVVFGSPEPDPKQYEHAVLTAVEMQAAAAKINQRRRAGGLPCAEPGIGIHCGEVVHGFVGSAERIEYTVIGDVVNKTARRFNGAVRLGGKDITHNYLKAKSDHQGTSNEAAKRIPTSRCLH